MTTPNLPVSQWPVVVVPDPASSIMVLNPKDTVTPPAGPGGSNQRIPLSTLIGAVVWPSGDISGVKDTANIIAAIAQVPASGGTVVLVPTAQWYINCGPIIVSRSGVFIDATGCFINALGAGDLVRMYDPSPYNGRTVHGGGWRGGIIDGINTTGPACAFHMGDIFYLTLDDFIVSRFGQAGSKGVWLDNAYYWTEQAHGRFYVKAVAGACVVFDHHDAGNGTSTGSHDRDVFEIGIENDGIGDGILAQNGAFIVDGKLNVRGNFSTGSAQHAVFHTSGSGSSFTLSEVNAGVELGDTANTLPVPVLVDNSGGGIINCRGIMDFSAGDAFGGSVTNGAFAYSGMVFGDSKLRAFSELQAVPSSQALSVNGSTILTNTVRNILMTTGAGTLTGFIMQQGFNDGQRVTVVNASAAGSVTMAAAATSHVANGTACVISALQAAEFVWSAANGLWYQVA